MLGDRHVWERARESQRLEGPARPLATHTRGFEIARHASARQRRSEASSADDEARRRDAAAAAGQRHRAVVERARAVHDLGDRAIKSGDRTPIPNNLAAIRRAIEDAGIELIFSKASGSAAGIRYRDAGESA